MADSVGSVGVFKVKSLIAAAVLGLSLTGAASAAVVLQDDFNYGSADALDVGVNFFAPNWTAGSTLDYIATDFYGDLCRDTDGCVDLDGSTNSSGLLSSVLIFAAGTYELAFELFGNNRGWSDDAVTITLGSFATTIFNIASGDDVSNTLTFTTTGGALTFQNAGGDNVGAVLSSVTLSAIPLPAGGLLLLGALGGIAALRRRKAA